MGSKSAIGIGNGVCFKQVRDKGGGSYIDPLVRDSIVGLWKFDQNTNESPTRNIIKNTIKDKGGDLELLNFAYKANSGYNGYPEDFTSWGSDGVVKEKTSYTFLGKSPVRYDLLVVYMANSSAVESFKVEAKISGKLLYRYYVNDGDSITAAYYELKEGINTLPYSVDSTLIGGKTGFVAEDFASFEVTQIPDYEGALVTNGKDDMIVSQKTVQEMLGGSNKITVVSMIHQIGRVATNTNLFTNCIQANTGSKGCNIVNYQTSLGKTGIYGYSRANVSVANNEVVINNILGDKADYLTNASIGALTSNEKFSVVGYLDVSPQQVTSVAVYWTFISNKVLTTDEINQIIAHYKLDKYVTPQVIYDVKRQGLTNDTPAADWYLKDFSGNGHDMTLYNFAKKLDSGVGKWAADYTAWTKIDGVVVTPTGFKIVEEISSDYWLLFLYNTVVPAHKIKVSGIPKGGTLKYAINSVILENGINELPEMEADSARGFTISMGTTQFSDWTGLLVEQIPDYEGALVSDGIDDYGKVENLPIYKDYTVVADREIVDGLIDNVDGGVATRSSHYGNGAFGFDWKNQAFSFGGNTDRVIDVSRFISYQSKYVNNGIQLTVGNKTDNNPLYMARLGEENRYSKLALWSFLLFPYSLSEFLLERQLKRYKLGTLYPDMMEFRPVISGNIPYNAIEISQGSTTLYNKSINKTGIYLQEGSTVRVYIQPSGIDEVSKITINGVEYTDLPINPNGYYYADFPITKSPQKISYAIDEYIRYEDIVQPYPAIINLKQDGKTITWGDKLKVGSDIVFVESANLLPELYTVSDTRYNGVTLYPNTIIKVEKSMVFDNARTYLKANEPSCILSPNRLRIPNSSYKILGHIPDLTGKGNHGRLNNFAYTEESGANEGGSIRFDGKDDHITIPALGHGGKCMLMKVNWNKDGLILYDQRRDNNLNSFAIYIPNFNNEDSIAYSSRNDGKTYIDGVLNTSVKGSQLKDVTHNITITNSNSNNNNTVSPVIGSNAKHNAFYARMALYEFMLFPDVPDEEEIKELNDIVGIEGGYVESPNYYYDAYGKKNTDTDRNLIADQISKDVANALEVKNVAYNSESGYTDDNGLLLDGVEDHAINTVIPAVTDFTVIAKRTDLRIIDDLTSSFIQKRVICCMERGWCF